MCGIFGYAGKKDASSVVLEGLKRLEYRGYDSWGIAVVENQIKVDKKVGAIGDIDSLSSLPKSSIGIGHTRWATHGGITEANAHPYFSSDKSFALAQNGIVENYSELKNNLLKKGYTFETDTDTEVIVRLIEDVQNSHASRTKLKGNSDLKEAIRKAFLKLEGRNTIIVLTRDGQIIAARNGSPLVVAVDDKEIFFSSDTLSFAPFVDKVIVVDNGQMVYYNNEQSSSANKLSLIDIKSNKTLSYHLEKINFKSSEVDKKGYNHFMIKEIH